MLYCILVKMLFYCCMNNANKSPVSLRSTFSDCHILLHLLHSFVQISFNYYRASMGCHGCHQQTSVPVYNRVDFNWTVTVIIRFRLTSELNVDDTIYSSTSDTGLNTAHHGCRPLWQIDTNFRQYGV